VSLRLLFPGLAWSLLMILVIAAPIKNNFVVFFDFVPGIGALHGLLFLGFVHIWIAALKKQLKHDQLRKKAIPLVLMVAITLILLVNSYLYLNMSALEVFILHIGIDLAGAFLGLLTFKFLYYGCF